MAVSKRESSADEDFYDDDEDDEFVKYDEEDEPVVKEHRDSPINHKVVNEDDSEIIDDEQEVKEQKEEVANSKPASEIKLNHEKEKPSQVSKCTVNVGEKNEETERKVMDYFVTRLKQVNNIIQGMTNELSRNVDSRGKDRCCRTCKFGGTKADNNNKNKEAQNKHKHGKTDTTKKRRGICCITRKDPDREITENCIVCQLIGLQERVDVLLDKKFENTDDECIKELKDEQIRLKNQVQKLIKSCDKSVIKDKISETVDRNSTDSVDSKRSSSSEKNNEDDNKGCKLFRYKSDASKVSKLQKSVFLNCINELVILIKSMNCVTSPGTFWQKRTSIKEEDTTPKTTEKCCKRDYPHMHGELNGVPVILKLYPSRSKKCKEEEKEEEKEEPPPPEEVQEEEEIEEVEEAPQVVETPIEQASSKQSVDNDDSLSSETLSEETLSNDTDQYSDDLEYAIEVKEVEDRSVYRKSDRKPGSSSASKKGLPKKQKSKDSQSNKKITDTPQYEENPSTESKKSRSDTKNSSKTSNISKNSGNPDVTKSNEHQSSGNIKK